MSSSSCGSLPVLRVLYVDGCVLNVQLVAEILHEMTEQLPAHYVFDVVTSNFAAVARVSRITYHAVCLAEDRSSSLDGRSAAEFLRQTCPGLTLILLLDDNRVKSHKGEVLGVREGDHRIECHSKAEDKTNGNMGKTRAGITTQRNEEVDFSVVDYVLRKPFSNETFQRLLKAVEDDQKQVPLIVGRVSEPLSRIASQGPAGSAGTAGDDDGGGGGICGDEGTGRDWDNTTSFSFDALALRNPDSGFDPGHLRPIPPTAAIPGSTVVSQSQHPPATTEADPWPDDQQHPRQRLHPPYQGSTPYPPLNSAGLPPLHQSLSPPYPCNMPCMYPHAYYHPHYMAAMMGLHHHHHHHHQHHGHRSVASMPPHPSEESVLIKERRSEPASMFPLDRSSATAAMVQAMVGEAGRGSEGDGLTMGSPSSGSVRTAMLVPVGETGANEGELIGGVEAFPLPLGAKHGEEQSARPSSLIDESAVDATVPVMTGVTEKAASGVKTPGGTLAVEGTWKRSGRSRGKWPGAGAREMRLGHGRGEGMEAWRETEVLCPQLDVESGGGGGRSWQEAEALCSRVDVEHGGVRESIRAEFEVGVRRGTSSGMVSQGVKEVGAVVGMETVKGARLGVSIMRDDAEVGVVVARKRPRALALGVGSTSTRSGVPMEAEYVKRHGEGMSKKSSSGGELGDGSQSLVVGLT